MNLTVILPLLALLLVVPAAGQPVTQPEGASGKRLIVLVPGLGRTNEIWDPLISRMKREPEFSDKETDWLLFEHSIHAWSFGHLEDTARELRAQIDEKWTAANGYREIVFAGHSLGGLIARQTYLLAAGAMPGAPVAAPWISRVTRMVLYATPNSGSTKFQFANGLARGMAKPFGVHLTVSDLYRGSDFIANLRINWIRYFATLTNPPTVTQFRGVQDTTVNKEDSTDVLSFPNAGFQEVPGASHDNILNITSEARYLLLRTGFTQQGQVAPSAPLKPERVVFLLHGIRASNVDDWVRSVEAEVKRQDPTAIVVRPGYNYFSAAHFALSSQRRKNIPWFQETYAQILAEHRNAEFDFIGHSNGTYILGQSLERVKGMRFKNVVLAGSVLPVDYPWGQRIADGQVARVRNDRADRDWPVGLLCNGLRGLFMRDIGTGGFEGFRGWQTKEVAYFPGDHGAALRPSNVASVVKFALGGDLEQPANLSLDPGSFRTLSRMMPYLTFSIAVSALLWWLVWPLWRTRRVQPRRLVTGVVVLILVYVILDII